MTWGFNFPRSQGINLLGPELVHTDINSSSVECRLCIAQLRYLRHTIHNSQGTYRPIY